ncbi:hypothetical protein RUM43_013708 [Polyplax serrata]|uniref:Cytosolic carboxypeptidase N-terminal domain-containing protein n=1 Tax=Polyplax serrata TaxID=468196 RepID=A0AAN8RZV3_POLSC
MGDEDSDDSEGEGGMGNLNRLIIRPPGHSGKAKRGHLCFDASYETGNLGRVDLISEFEYDLFIRPDTCNPRARQWFNFSVDNTKVDQRVIFNIQEEKSLRARYDAHHQVDESTKMVRSFPLDTGRKVQSELMWCKQRIPKKYVYYYKSPEHNGQNVLSICHGFDREEDIYQFAFSFPFSYSKCQAHLKQMEQKQFPFFKRELLAKSIQMRRIDVITITNPANVESSKKQRIVFILGRINPGDSPTSFACQGKCNNSQAMHTQHRYTE